jgi:hypothetical protein
MTSALLVATVLIAATCHADVINVCHYYEIWTVVQIWDITLLHWIVVHAYLEWTSVTPYKLEMTSKMPSPYPSITEKRKMMMASKNNKRKYSNSTEEDAEESTVPPKKQRMMTDDSSSLSTDDFSSELEEEVSSGGLF